MTAAIDKAVERSRAEDVERQYGQEPETLREHINSLTDNDVWCVFNDALGDAPIDCGSLAKLLDQLLEEHEAWDGFNSYLFKATCAEFMANVLKTMSQQTGFKL